MRRARLIRPDMSKYISHFNYNSTILSIFIKHPNRNFIISVRSLPCFFFLFEGLVRRIIQVESIDKRNKYIKKIVSTNLWSHCSRSCAVRQLKYLGPPLLGVTWKQCGLPRRLGCSGVTAARSIEVTAWPQSNDSCERQPRRPAAPAPMPPRCFWRSSFVTLFVRFSGFERNERFEKKFCNVKRYRDYG